MKKEKRNVQRTKNQSGRQVINEATTDGLFNDSMAYAIHPHTEICVNLKIMDTKCPYIHVGGKRRGSLVHDAPGHFSFTAESAMRKLAGVKSKNECLLSGQCVNVKRNRDGVIFPTFRYGQLNKGNLSFMEFCVLGAKELLQVSDLIEKQG